MMMLYSLTVVVSSNSYLSLYVGIYKIMYITAYNLTTYGELSKSVTTYYKCKKLRNFIKNKTFCSKCRNYSHILLQLKGDK